MLIKKCFIYKHFIQNKSCILEEFFFSDARYKYLDSHSEEAFYNIMQ